MLGSTLLPKILLKKNSKVVGIDNLKLGKIKFIKKFLNKKNFFFFKANLDKRIKSLKFKQILAITILFLRISLGVNPKCKLMVSLISSPSIILTL